MEFGNQPASLNMPLSDTVSLLFCLIFVLSLGYGNAKDLGALCSTCKQITDNFNKVGPVLWFQRTSDLDEHEVTVEFSH